MFCALYPGQGSQTVGMGKFLYENFKEAQSLFEEASDTLSVDMKKLCFEGQEAELQKTHNTQPALLLVSAATNTVVNNVTGIDFSYGAGHSVGEYAACVGSQSIMFRDAMMAVRKRGEFMQSAVPLGEGSMVAVMGLSPHQVEKMCEWTVKKSGFSPVEPANFNSPGQIVCSGSAKAIAWLHDNFDKDVVAPEAKRVKLIPLKVSAPFHCSMMKPAEENMAKVLQDIPFRNGSYPVVQNVNAEPVIQGDEIRKNLIAQISAPVLWETSVKKLRELGCSDAVELGAGSVIKGLVKKICGDEFRVWSLNSLEDLKALEARS